MGIQVLPEKWLTPLLLLCASQQEMPTGQVEVLAESVEVFNLCRKLPFEIKDFVKVSQNACGYYHMSCLPEALNGCGFHFGQTEI